MSTAVTTTAEASTLFSLPGLSLFFQGLDEGHTVSWLRMSILALGSSGPQFSDNYVNSIHMLLLETFRSLKSVKLLVGAINGILMLGSTLNLPFSPFQKIDNGIKVFCHYISI